MNTIANYIDHDGIHLRDDLRFDMRKAARSNGVAAKLVSLMIEDARCIASIVPNEMPTYTTGELLERLKCRRPALGTAIYDLTSADVVVRVERSVARRKASYRLNSLVFCRCEQRRSAHISLQGASASS